MEGISLSTNQLLIAFPSLLSAQSTLPVGSGRCSVVHGAAHLGNDGRDRLARCIRILGVSRNLINQHRPDHNAIGYLTNRCGSSAVGIAPTEARLGPASGLRQTVDRVEFER